MTSSEIPQEMNLPPEVVFAHPPATADADESWWGRYQASLADFTATARAVLEADCNYVVDRGIYGPGVPSAHTWPANRVRRGLVMGSVQSGKTASMLGTIARSLDRGTDIVVVLAGTRLSLWQQTLDRLREQLDPGPDSAEKQRRRILLPKTPPAESIPIASRYQLSAVRVQRALARNQPIIVTALKHAGHLQALGQSLKQSVFPEIGNLGRPVHMLVLDDEADDGSVLDANVEASQDPIFGNLKQIPRAISDLWCPPSDVAPENLFSTYIGYTATPQANFLQEDHNPLSPRDFVVTLRTPLDRGDLATRSSTYTEPRGIDHYYTGGEVFYRRGRDAELCIATTGNPQDDLSDAMRAFLVAGAVRLHRDSQRIGPYSARGSTFESMGHVREVAPRPHSMLIHPSALVSDHFTTAEDVLLWAGVLTRGEARSRLDSGDCYLPAILCDSVDTDEAEWSVWLDRYKSSSISIDREFNALSSRDMPDWQTVKRLLKEEVIPGTRLAVINSDPAADDRPEYTPTENADGTWFAPRDMSTIFVSGNVMARGLTLEGLTTTLFLRATNSPLADTQMQMQRWFGYRGSYIELCRVFASQDQIEFFSSYHDVDEALRNVLAEAMKSTSVVPKPEVLQGRGFLATGKIANLGNKPLHPGRKPFIPLINSGVDPDPNALLVSELFAQRPSQDVIAGDRVRGRILDSPLTLTQAANLLDGLSYAAYRPGQENQLGELWSQVESRLNAIQALPAGFRLYRAPSPQDGAPVSPVRKDCPYGIPAYLRLWDASLSRHVRGLFVTGARDELWSMVDLTTKSAQAPKFWVGIRYGAAESPTAGGPFRSLPFQIRTTRRRATDGIIKTTWGTNAASASAAEYRGDEYFDFYHHHAEYAASLADDEAWRPPGADGQILFYVNQQPDQTHPTIAIGVCVPAGGPDQFAARVQPSMSPQTA